MRGRFMSGIMAGSIVGATAGMYAMTRMSPRQRRKMMKMSKKAMFSLMDSVKLF